MVLKKLIESVGKNLESLEVLNISQNSKSCKKGDAYFCLTSDQKKAKERCEEALSNGAEIAISNFGFDNEKCLSVKDVRECFAYASKNFYDNACDAMKMVAVCGTNGKTSTSHIIAEMLRRNGKKVGVIGTSGVFYNGKSKECPLTTPDADFLHSTFKAMKDDGVEVVVMEVSAHAVDQKRVCGICFDVGVLTNITQDHLDYFDNMENYERTKLSFFKKQNVKRAVICADDERARKLLYHTDIPIVTYGLEYPSDVFAINVKCDMSGTKFVANVNDSVVDVKTNLIGDYNVYNSLASLAVCQELGLVEKELESGLNYINPVEGRFNVIKVGDKYAVIDFAHSPDGLFNVLSATKKMAEGHVFVIFGCGGNRDKTKRPQMGKIAEQIADFVCLTDDNPRLEKSYDIISDIEVGMGKPHFVEPNRPKAIRKMLDFARAGDVVVIAGKGAERYQEIGAVKYPYNDFEEVYKYCRDKKFKALKNQSKKEEGKIL